MPPLSELKNNTVELARRDNLTKETIAQDELVETIERLLIEIQKSLFDKAAKFRNEHITEVNSFEEFKDVLETKGGFVSAHWDGTVETEERIKENTKATIRCIPLNTDIEAGKCVFSGNESTRRVLFAKAY